MATNDFQEQFKDHMEFLSHHHGRTLDQEEYKIHKDIFKSKETEILRHNNSQAVREKLFLNSIHKQRFWAEIVNFIFSVNDVMNPGSLKAPVIVFGNGKFSGGLNLMLLILRKSGMAQTIFSPFLHGFDCG